MAYTTLNKMVTVFINNQEVYTWQGQRQRRRQQASALAPDGACLRRSTEACQRLLET